MALSRAELHRLMERQFGSGWRSKMLVSPVGTFRLRDVDEECGFPPERIEPARGLFQMLPSRLM